MDVIEEIGRYFKHLEAQERFSGVLLITQSSRSLYTGAYGYASRAWKIPNTLEIRFDTASITKLFTAVAVLQMIDQGRLAFDTGVTTFLGLEGTAVSTDVNVFHLLTHSSGIGDDADEEAGESYEALWKNRPNYSVTETSDFIAQCTERPPNFPPGQGCRYCNCGYVLLGLMVERAAGVAYREYVRRHIFEPVGMARSDFFRMDRVHEDVAEGSDPLTDEAGRVVGWRRNIYAFPPVGSPDGGAQVTAGDLDRFLRAVRAGRLLSPRLTEAFFTPQVHHSFVSGGSHHAGHGLWFVVDPAGRTVYCEKEGINVGVSGIIRHYPAADLNVVMLSNMEAGVWEPVKKVHQLVTDGGLA